MVLWKSPKYPKSNFVLWQIIKMEGDIYGTLQCQVICKCSWKNCQLLFKLLQKVCRLKCTTRKRHELIASCCNGACVTCVFLLPWLEGD